MEIVTKSQAKERGLKYYFTGKSCKNGHVVERYLSGHCSECRNNEAKSYYQQNVNKARKRRKEYYKHNREKCLNDTKQWKECHKEKIKAYESNRSFYKKEYYKNTREIRKQKASEYYQKNKENILQTCRTYRNNNKQKIKTSGQRWRLRNLNLKRLYAANYRARKIRATPKWSESIEIKELYLNCPEGYHVDHIVPLQNKIVCGLHVIANLQYLTKQENTEKGNKFCEKDQYIQIRQQRQATSSDYLG